MLRSVRSLLSLGIPLLILICIAILGLFTFASIRQTAYENGMSITRLTADSRHESLLRYLKRQRMQAKNFVERSKRLCSLMDVEKKTCLQTALDGFVASIDAESARLDVPGVPIIISGEGEDWIPRDPTPDLMTEFKFNKKGEPFFVLDAKTDDGSHILTLHVRLNIIHEIFKNPDQLGDIGETFLVAGNGFFISPPRHFRTLIKEETASGDLNIQKCKEGNSFDSSKVSVFGKEFIASFRSVKELSGGCVIAILLEDQALMLVEDLKWEWFSLILIFAILSSIAGYLLTRRITRPMQELSEMAISLQQGNFDIRKKEYGALKEIRLFEETFRKMANSLQAQIKNQEEVMAIVSHDLKNPIAAMKMSAQIAQRSLKKDSLESQKEVIVKALSRIDHQTDQMSRLIEDLMDVARAQSGKLEINFQKVMISKFLTTIESLKPLSQAKEIKLQINFPDNSQEVMADVSRINQVFSNLIGNAIKFTNAGGQIEVGSKEEPEKMLFWVRDSGLGIPEEQLPHIFKKHWQAQGEQKKGVGLGLFITKTIIDGHGGDIWVESSSSGSTFYFTLRKA